MASQVRSSASAEVGDAVVMEHTKYRILAIGDHRAALADSGPRWRTSPTVGAVRIDALRWDAIVGVWRVAK